MPLACYIVLHSFYIIHLDLCLEVYELPVAKIQDNEQLSKPELSFFSVTVCFDLDWVWGLYNISVFNLFITKVRYLLTCLKTKTGRKNKKRLVLSQDNARRNLSMHRNLSCDDLCFVNKNVL